MACTPTRLDIPFDELTRSTGELCLHMLDVVGFEVICVYRLVVSGLIVTSWIPEGHRDT